MKSKPTTCTNGGSCGPCSRGLCPGIVLLGLFLLVQGGMAFWHWLFG